MCFSFFGRSFFIFLTLLLSCNHPEIQACHPKENEDDHSFLEKCLPRGLLDSQEISPPLFPPQQTITQDVLATENDSTSSSEIEECFENAEEEHSNNTSLSALNASDIPFSRLYPDLQQAFQSLAGEEKLTKRTFLNEKNIPIYKNVYYGLSNGFKKYIFEGSVLLKAGMHACRFLSLTSLYHNLTPLWENSKQIPHLPWMYLPRENALFSGFIVEPINPLSLTSKTGEKSFDVSLKSIETVVDRLSPDVCGALFSSQTPFFLHKKDLIKIMTHVFTPTDFLKGEQLNWWLKKGTKLCNPNNTTLFVAHGEDVHIFSHKPPITLPSSFNPNVSASCEDVHIFSRTPPITLSSSSHSNASASREEKNSDDEWISTEENSTGSVRITSEDSIVLSLCESSQDKALYTEFNDDFHKHFKDYNELTSINLYNIKNLTVYPDIEYTVSISPNHSGVLSGQEISYVGARLCSQLSLGAIKEKDTLLWENQKKIGTAPWIYIPKSNPLFRALIPTSFIKKRESCGGIYVKDKFFEILPDDTLTFLYPRHRQTFVIKGDKLTKKLTSHFNKRKQKTLALSKITQNDPILYQWNAQTL